MAKWGLDPRPPIDMRDLKTMRHSAERIALVESDR
jgi:hypothetical protein